ncbi:FkbM family methyltransferase [Synergistaceae bacterium OttesenSCG-928-I11]|nr:FkbM family methyltransferase [Synergistaceae bacterium OttesenSCG-928-I11]
MLSFSDELSAIIFEYNTNKNIEKLESFGGLRSKSKALVIYGCGAFGHSLYDFFAKHNIEITAFCDTFKNGVDPSTGLAIISPDSLTKIYPDANVVLGVGASQVRNKMKNKLRGISFSGSILDFSDIMFPIFLENEPMNDEELLSIVTRYEKVWSMLSDDTSRGVLLDRMRLMLLWKPMRVSPIEHLYFEPGIINLNADEVFVDGGFFDGETSLMFADKTKGRFAHIFAFEPSKIPIEANKLNGHENFTLITKGLWAHDKLLNFSDVGRASSCVCENGDISISVTSIDNYFNDKTLVPTFIKLDIEGSEKQALLGAKRIISTFKPKLAISVYHRPEDLNEIPEIIKNFNNGYDFYLRHYTESSCDTVLYAV